ncbi:hypothetical protein JXC34_07360 [Candidatus Woesearchaeota archaeon]|nr:hypothetical protein [Candidatus Woesearchaeota archaeon]
MREMSKEILRIYKNMGIKSGEKILSKVFYSKAGKDKETDVFCAIDELIGKHYLRQIKRRLYLTEKGYSYIHRKRKAS